MKNIYKNIIKNNQLTAKEKSKKVLYYFSRRRGAKKSWNKRHRKVFEQNNSYNNPCNAQVEAEHQEIWSPFRKNVDMSTLRICKNISGRADAKMIPEDVFVSDIEPTLISDGAVHFLSHKSFYNQWFPEGIFPEDIFHCIEGQYLDSELNSIGLDDLKKKAKNILYPVVIKPNWGSYGGKDVYFVENTEKLVTLCKASCDFVVQEQIRQHKFFRRYNPGGPNTIRVYVYKSVKDHKPHVINMALRMGRGGSLDNETDGGLHTIIDEEGFLNNYAVDKYGEKFTEHPDTGYSFDDKIPAVDELKELALKISEQIYFTRIIGLDLCYDSLSRWRAIEVNTKGHTIRFAQYGGQPFFREFTDEVIEYCKKIIRH